MVLTYLTGLRISGTTLVSKLIGFARVSGEVANLRDSLLPYVKNVFSSPYLDTQTKLYFETFSSFRYMMILHFAPNFQKLHFCTTENFGVKS